MPELYVADNGAPSNRGRVSAVPASPTRFSRFVPPPELRGELAGPIRCVHLDPDGMRVVVRTADEAVVYEPYGGRRFNGTAKDADRTVATELGLVYGGELFAWDGEEPLTLSPSWVLAPPRRQLAAAIIDRAFVTAAHQRRPWKPARLWTGSDDLDPYALGKGWLGDVEPATQVAIADDGRIVIVRGCGEVEVLSAGGDKNRGVPVSAHRADIGAGAFAVTVGEEAIVVLRAIAESTDLLARRLGIGRAEGTEYITEVICLTPDLGEITRTRVPLAAISPAILGDPTGRGRIYLAGYGFAALDAGAMEWCRPSPKRGFATACGDGSLLAAADRTLAHLDPSADALACAFTPEGLRLCTPPAVDPDGRVYVGAGSDVWIWE